MPPHQNAPSARRGARKRATPAARRTERTAPPTLEALEDRTLPNGGPVLSLPQTTFSVVKTTTLSVLVSATDRDSGEKLTFSLANAPAGATISTSQVYGARGSAATGTLTWTPTQDQGPASYTFTVKVADNDYPAHSASQTVTVTTLAAGLVGNNLLIVGTSGDDTVSVDAPAAANAVLVTVNGATTGPFTVRAGGSILANLFAGNDSFTLNESPVKVGPAVVVDGGAGTNALTDNGTAGADAYTVTAGAVSLAGAGDLRPANFQSLALNTLGGGDTVTLTGLNPATATTIDADGGPADTDTFTGNLAGSFSGSLTLANFESATMQVGGDFDGSLTVNVPGGLQQFSVAGTVSAASVIQATSASNVTIGTLAGQLIVTEVAGVAGSGQLNDATIDTLSGALLAGSINGLNVGTVTGGAVITAAGQGTTSNVSIGTNAGTFTAPEDGTDGSGVMSNTTVGTNTGTISTGSISGMSVTTNSGSITAAGQGTTTGVSIGTNAGSFTAPEDGTAGSGTMSDTTVGTNTGTISTGSISGMSVTTNSGSITAAGQGTTSNVSIGTNAGSFTAPEDGTTGSGTMSDTTVGTNTGAISTGSISGMSVTTNSGSITAAGQGTTTGVSIGTNAGSFTAPEDGTAGSGTMSDTTVGSNTGTISTGSISGMSVTTNSGSITAAGQGTISDISIGTLAGTLAAKADSTPGSGTLSNATFGTVLGSATLTAGHFDVLTAQHASPVVNFSETAVTRTLALTPHNGGTVPDYGFYYDGSGSGDPRIVVQINAATPGSFDLAAFTSASTIGGSGFDLAGLYSAGGAPTGAHNVVVGGDLLLNAVPAGAVSFFQLPANTAGGVQLPQDTVAVAVAGNAPAASITAKSVGAIAAGSFAGVSAGAAGTGNALTLLAPGTTLLQANDSYHLFVSEANPVAQFLVTGTGGSFDGRKMLFADQVNDNRPVTATDFLVPSGSSTAVNEVDFTGQGGSLTTAQPILTAINGPGATLGDLILSAPSGITANITADAILGNIEATSGSISGVIQATVGDIGRALTDANGNVTGVTNIQAVGGGLTGTGQIVSRGNLVSQITLSGGLSGVVAAGGDIGAIRLTNGLAPQAPAALTRFGGIVVSGGLGGQVVALGNVFGDIVISGGLSGRIAARGREEFGLSANQSFSRTGILGNVVISGGISPTGAIVSAGLLGDDGSDNTGQDTQGTRLTISGNDKGILAAEEDINFGATSPLNAAGTFENATGANKNAIDYIFTNNGNPLTVPDGLGFILQDLLALTVLGNGNLGGTTQ